MAFQLLVNGVDKTAYLKVNPPPRFTRKQNERSVVELSFRPGFLPSAYADFVLKDGATPVFRGVLLPHIVELDRGPMDVGVDATGYDYAFFFDRSYWTKTYTTSKTAKQILTDLVSEKLSAYGISLDGAQDNGDTFINYTVTDMKVSDVLRSLGAAHTAPRVYTITPTLTLLLTVPGSTSAAFSVTDSAASFYQMRWSYSDVVPANDVTITFGPNGLGDPITYTWIGDGSTTVFSLAGVSPRASEVWPGIVVVNGVSLPMWPPGSGPTDRIEWDFATNDGTLTFIGAAGPVPVGQTITLTYTPQLPFSVNATTGASPKLEARFSDQSVPTFAVAQATVDGKLIELNQNPRNLSIITWQYAEPGQLLSVQNAKRAIASPTNFTISQVSAEYTEFFSLGTRLWVYTISATETTTYQGSYIARARELFGGGSGGGSIVTSSGGSTTLPALPSGYIWVGDATNVAQAVVMSGDATISNTGVVTVSGGGGGMTTLPTGQIYIGNGSNVATANPMSGDISIGTTGITAIGTSKVTSAMIVDGTIVNADINASAGIVDTKLTTISTAGKVSNSATTATSAATASAIVARDSNGDTAVRALFAHYVIASSTDLELSSTTGAVSVTAAGALNLSPTGNIITDPTGNSILPNANYDINIGMLSKKYLTLHAAELWVETLVAQNTMATIGGRVLVAPTNILTVDCAPSDTSITVKYNNFLLHVIGVETGSKLYLESDGKFEAMQITSTVTPTLGASGYVYTVTRDLDGTGANQWYAGDAVLDTGKTGSGFIDLYSVQGIVSGAIGPSIVGNVRLSTTYNDVQERWAIGNLNGVFGYASDIYGAAFGSPSAAWIKIDPTNGVRIGHNATTVTQIDASGNASFIGTVTAAAGAIGGWSIGADYIRDAANSSGMASTVTGGDDVRFWAGAAFASRGSAPFRVTESGAVVMTSATIGGDGSGITNINGGNIQTGTITATQIAAGAITTPKLAAGSVTATNITVTNKDNISPDPGYYDPVFQTSGVLSAWNSTIQAFDGSGSLAGEPFRLLGATGHLYYYTTPFFQVDVGASYNIRLRIYREAGVTGYFGGFVHLPGIVFALPGATGVSPDNAGFPAIDLSTLTAGSWLEFSAIYTTSSSQAGIQFYHAFNTSGGSIYYAYEVTRAATASLIVDGTITAVKIAANTITAGQIAAGTITATQIASATITAGNIASATITGTQIAATTIAAGNIVSGTITATQIASATITAGNIASGTITATQIAASTITGGQIAANTITAGNIAAGTITATEIAANTITAGKLNVSTLSAITADLGAVTAGTININSGQFMVSAIGDVYINNMAGGTVVLNGTMESSGVLIDTGGSGGFLQVLAFGGGGVRQVFVDNTGLFFV